MCINKLSMSVENMWVSHVWQLRLFTKAECCMEYIVHGSKNQIDSSIFTYFGAI